MKEVVWVVFMFVCAMASITITIVSSLNTKNSYDKAENFSPTEEVSGVIMQGWDVIKDSANPNSRIVIQCTDGKCNGYWAPNR